SSSVKIIHKHGFTHAPNRPFADLHMPKNSKFSLFADLHMPFADLHMPMAGLTKIPKYAGQDMR
ncbi:hypothetical protein ABWH80_10775, partial [Neisseria gonorrhoeae]|uniref:hypothetical protein n=1 Tax=Neisseria gonorrhoeae TaxID=485 RepID=UPI0034E94641